MPKAPKPSPDAGGWTLAAMSAGLTAAADRREADRQAVNEQLEALGCLLFLPTEDAPEGHGIGWFQVQDYLVAYQRYSNGYAQYPCQQLHIQMMRDLLSKVK